MKRPLPPLNAIRAFHVAARHLNFSRAAEELGVTQGAISKQILILEDYIGTRLFERLPGGLELTTEGRSIRVALQPVFEALDETFSRFSRLPPRSNKVRISTVGSFAAQFLVPRLDRFQDTLPDIELELLTSARLVDFAREEIDLSVRYGPGGWNDVISKKLIEGRLVLVCAPRLLPQHGVVPDDLEGFINSQRRIQVFSNNEWRVWAEEMNMPNVMEKCPFIIEEFIVAIKAVWAAQGVALLPEILVRDSIAAGRMTLLSKMSLDWNQTFYIVHAPNASQRKVVKDVINWLEHEATQPSDTADFLWH